MNYSWQKLAVLLTLFLAFVSQAAAQATSGAIVGTVFDPTGAGVPGATVTLQNVATGVQTTATTNEAGQYRFNDVAIGQYQADVTAQNFNKATVNNINIELNRTSTVNFTIAVGTQNTTVEVTEALGGVDTATAQVASNFGTKQITDLPTANFTSRGGVAFGAYNMSLLSSGVASSGGVGQGRGPSVGGQRPTNNNFNVEGIDNNDKAVTGPLVYVPNEATAEFTLLQNQFAPEFGHSSGGQFNIVIRGGTNEWHGALYDYLQNRNLNALDVAFQRQGITENQRYDQNRLGGRLGFPIIKNKLFGFANYEYNPLGLASTPSAASLSPTAAGYQALASVPGISQTNLGILQQYLSPAPVASDTTTVGGRAIPIGILPISAPNYQNQYVGVGSLDWAMGSNDQLRMRYIHNKVEAINNAANLPSFFTPILQTALVASVAQYHNFSANITNELRLGYNRFVQDIPAGNFQYPGLDVFPNITIEQDLNVQLGPQPEAPQGSVFNTYQLTNNVNWTAGKHTFRFGYDGRRLIAPQTFTQRSRGDYGYSTLERFVLDLQPDLLAQRSIGNAPYSGDRWSQFLYFNDNWRISNHLTLNLGARYEYITVPKTLKQQSLNAAASVPGVFEFQEPRAQKTNWAPRVGIAYSPGNTGRTAIRAGFGMAYDQIYDNLNILSLPPQFSTTIDLPLGSDAPGFLRGGGIRPDAPVGQLTPEEARSATASFVPINWKRPYSIQWNFGIQQQFMQSWTLEARYLGNRGVNLPVQSIVSYVARANANRSLPLFYQQPSQAQLNALPLTLSQLQALPVNQYEQFGFDSPITSFQPIGNSVYHGLALQANKRMARGLQFIGAYTWSHNIDDSTASLFSTLMTPRRPQDFQNLRPERSSSALDRRHRVTITPLWEMPFFRSSENWAMKNIVGNWTLSGVYTFESPQYATVQSGRDANLNNDSAPDRVFVNPNGQSGVGSDVTALTNSAGQTVGYLANNPNAQYIRAGLGQFPNGGRNTLATRPINNFDVSVFKGINVTERTRIEFRADAYNAINHPQFSPGQINNINLTSRNVTRNFLIPGLPEFNNPETAFESNARVLQLGLRVSF